MSIDIVRPLLDSLNKLIQVHSAWALDLQLCHDSVLDAAQGLRRDPREALILAAVAIGAQTLQDISTETSISRTVVFRMLRDLEELGEIKFRRGLYGRVYSFPDSPGMEVSR